MPFVKKDVPKLARGIEPEKVNDWKTVANQELKKCVAQGGDELTCEINAVRIATQSIKGSNLTDLKFKEISDLGHAFKNSFLENKANFIPLQEAKDTEDWQLILPIGTWYVEWYGEVIFTRRFMELIVENNNKKIMNQRQPYIDTDHDGGAANGWIKEMRAGDEGLEVIIEWNDRGKELLGKGIYKYFSAEIQSKLNIETNERIWPVLPAATLTNRPAMNTLPEAKLEEANKIVGTGTKDIALSDEDEDIDEDKSSTHGDRDKIDEGEMIMNFADLLKAIIILSDAEKSIVVKELGLTSSVEANNELVLKVNDLTSEVAKLKSEKEILAKVNLDLSEKVNTSEKKEIETRKTTVIEKALSEGRILPKDREYWEGKFDTNPDFTEEIIGKMGKVVSFDENGTDKTETADTKKVLSEEDKIVAANLKELGLSEDQIKEVV